jgi:DNA ligase (NAD+)
MSRIQVHERIRSLGGSVSNSISQRTDLVIAGSGAGSKLDEARQLNIRIMGENEFLAMLGEHPAQPQDAAGQQTNLDLG